MKKTKLLLSAAAVLSLCGFTTACTSGDEADHTLVVYNWEDYIDEGLDENGYEVGNSVIADFENYFYDLTGETIKVQYETFSTCEDVYNMLKLNSVKIDLFCPSDYMIQKMANEGMLEEFDYDEATDTYEGIDNYNDYASPYIKDLFKRNNFSKYAIPYTWGTMGYTYNPEKVDVSLVSTWEAQWNPQLSKRITVKDSVRDTIFTAVMHVYKSELDTLKAQYEAGTISAEVYNDHLTEIFNRSDDQTLQKVKQALIDMKDNIYGLEVDDGKNEIVTGTYDVSLSWSGDAVYSMDQGEDSSNPVYLNYVVPEEGSNIWYDGWCMPKGANTELAKYFLDYLSRPDIAARNMNVTGYTSSIAGDDIFDLVLDWYAADEEDPNYSSYDKVNLSYFFEGTLEAGRKAEVVVAERGRQFDAQYPTEDVMARCAMMKDYGDRTDAVYQIWNDFKASL